MKAKEHESEMCREYFFMVQPPCEIFYFMEAYVPITLFLSNSF